MTTSCIILLSEKAKASVHKSPAGYYLCITMEINIEGGYLCPHKLYWHVYVESKTTKEVLKGSIRQYMAMSENHKNQRNNKTTATV